MGDYRAYCIGQDGRVVRRHDFVAKDDDDAIELARQYLDGLDIELWTGRRKVGLVKAASAKHDRTA
jgi:hypothetical protein